MRFINALNGKNHDTPPIWMMRQAGRYMPEYRELREKFSFMQMCRTPELIKEITLQPIRRFGLDAAILFSDILVIPDAFGLGLRVEDGIGPIIEHPIRTEEEIDRLEHPQVEKTLGYVKEGIDLLLQELSVPLLGFCGAPFTVASYMIEGGSSRDLVKTRSWMHRRPKAFHKLLEKITLASIDYLKMQADAGVVAVQIFESWASYLDAEHFQEFSLYYLEKMVAQLKRFKCPVILFFRGGAHYAKQASTLNMCGLSVDWTVSLKELRKEIGPNIVLQGNLDPAILLTDKETIAKQVDLLASQMAGDPAFIFNLGHGIHKTTPIENVEFLMECVKKAFSKPSLVSFN